LASVPEYSEMEAPNIQPQISITSDELSTLLKNVIPFSGKGTGVELEFNNGILNTSATDMHDFIMCKTLTEDSIEPITAYVLPEDLEIVMRIVKNYAQAVEVTIGNKNIKWACGNSTIITRNSSIIFPDKRKLDAIKFNFFISIYRDDLLESVKQVTSLITKGEGSMKITFHTEYILVEASTQNEYIKYTLLAEHNMPVNSILFVHPESLLLALNIIKDSEFKILLDENMGILKMQSENLVIINALMRR
jgi:DNA polymerase III sliding clamp (beta) subunit (PCNA family)